MPPSNMPVPTESTPMVASFSAPSLLHSSCDISSGIRTPLAASQTQPEHVRLTGPVLGTVRRAATSAAG